MIQVPKLNKDKGDGGVQYTHEPKLTWLTLTTSSIKMQKQPSCRLPNLNPAAHTCWAAAPAVIETGLVPPYFFSVVHIASF